MIQRKMQQVRPSLLLGLLQLQVILKHNQKSFHHTEWMQEIHLVGQSNKAVKDICISQLEEQKREVELVVLYPEDFHRVDMIV